MGWERNKGEEERGGRGDGWKRGRRGVEWEGTQHVVFCKIGKNFDKKFYKKL